MDTAKNHPKGEIKKGTDLTYPNKVSNILSVIFALKEQDGLKKKAVL